MKCSACRLHAKIISEFVQEKTKVYILVDKTRLDNPIGLPLDGSTAHTAPFDGANAK